MQTKRRLMTSKFMSLRTNCVRRYRVDNKLDFFRSCSKLLRRNCILIASNLNKHVAYTGSHKCIYIIFTSLVEIIPQPLSVLI